MLFPDDPIEDTLTVFIIVIPISKIQFQKRLQEVSIYCERLVIRLTSCIPSRIIKPYALYTNYLSIGFIFYDFIKFTCKTYPALMFPRSMLLDNTIRDNVHQEDWFSSIVRYLQNYPDSRLIRESWTLQYRHRSPHAPAH